MSQLNELIYQRYGETVPGALDHLNQTIEGLLNHRSVRSYLPDALDAGTLEWLVAAAQSAATSSNLQSWSVVAVEEKERKARLAKLSREQKHIVDAPLFLVWIVDLARLRHIARQAGTASAALDYIDSFLVGVIDAALAAQNLVVAAESLGLGTVYIGLLRNHPEEVAAELKLPTGAFPILGLVVGKPDPAVPTAVKPRLPQAAVLHREYYHTEARDEAIPRYDKILETFYAAQNLPQQAWTQQTANRIKGPESLGPRARLAEAIAKLGFKLQ